MSVTDEHTYLLLLLPNPYNKVKRCLSVPKDLANR